MISKCFEVKDSDGTFICQFGWTIVIQSNTNEGVALGYSVGVLTFAIN